MHPLRTLRTVGTVLTLLPFLCLPGIAQQPVPPPGTLPPLTSRVEIDPATLTTMLGLTVAQMMGSDRAWTVRQVLVNGQPVVLGPIEVDVESPVKAPPDAPDDTACPTCASWCVECPTCAMCQTCTAACAVPPSEEAKPTPPQ